MPIFIRLFFLCLGMLFIFSQPLFAREFRFASADIRIDGVESGDSVGQVNAALSDDVFLVGAGESSTQRGKLYVFQHLTLNDGIVTQDSSIASINGTSVNDFVGKFLAAGGDIDGDGDNDFLLGIPNTGQVKVYLAKDIETWGSGSSTVFISSFLNNASGSHLPQFLSVGGDVNGDGYDDILIGGNQDDSGANPNGSAFVVFGRSDIDDVSMLDMELDEADDVSIHFVGEESGDGTGYSVDIVPDINGDGFDEVVIGSYQHSGFTPGVGKKVHLIYGRADFSDVLTSTNNFDLNAADAVFFSKDNGSDGFGETVKGLGDINGDGYGDFAVSAPKSSSSRGKVYVYYGGQGTPFSGRYDAENVYAASISGDTVTNEFGLHAVASVGDSNGDLIHDLVIGEFSSTGEGINSGEAYLVYGGVGGTSLSGDSAISSLVDDVFYSDNAEADIGFSVGPAGDINQDYVNEVFIGSRAFDGTKGAVGIFSLYQNVTPSFTTETLELYTDETYSTTKTTFSNLDFVYVQVSADDPNSASNNVIGVVVTSDSFAKPVTITLADSEFHSGEYRGRFQIVRTRSKAFSRQVAAQLGDDLTLRLAYSDETNVISISNDVPDVITLNALQISTGNETRVVLTYQIVDGDEDMVSFENSANQVQYSSDGIVWSNASISGTTTAVSTNIMGFDHTETIQPLLWEAGSDVGPVDETYYVRIRPYDGSDLALYYSTINVHVDNQAPEAPVVSEVGTKHATSITVTGSAEVNTAVYVYVDNVFAASENVESDGSFSVFPVSVSTTSEEIVARVQDAVGFWSVSSNVVTLQFDDFTRTFTESGVVVEVDIPLGSVSNDSRVIFDLHPTPSVTEPVPYEKRYLQVFDLSIDDGEDVTAFLEPVTVTVNFATALSVNDGITVMYWDATVPTWSSDGITVDAVSNDDIVFRTSHFSRFAVVQNSDPFPPVIGQFLEGDRYLATDLYYGARPDFSITAQDVDSGIASWSITLSLVDGDDVAVTSSSNLLTTEATVLELGELDSDLADGQYQIVARVWDGTDNTATRSDTFYVNQTQFNFSMVAGPNPYNPDEGDLSIGYTLSLDADDVVMYIVNMRGHMIKRLKLDGVNSLAGYHIATWDGRDGNTTIVPNGVYFMYVIASRGGDTIKRKFKLAVLR